MLVGPVVALCWCLIAAMGAAAGLAFVFTIKGGL